MSSFASEESLFKNPRLPLRQRGIALVEVAVSLSVFTIIAVPVAITLLRSMEYDGQSHQMYLATSALRDRIADVQETANLAQNLVAEEGIGAVYDKYDGQTFTVAALPSGQISFECYADEAAVPVSLGGPQDLNFDGDATDNLTAVGFDLRLVPMVLTLTFAAGGGSQTIIMHRLITQTTN